MLKLVNEKKSFHTDNENYLSDCLAFIEESLKRTGAEKKPLLQSVLLAEEMLVELEKLMDPGGELHRSYRSR